MTPKPDLHFIAEGDHNYHSSLCGKGLAELSVLVSTYTANPEHYDPMYYLCKECCRINRERED